MNRMKIVLFVLIVFEACTGKNRTKESGTNTNIMETDTLKQYGYNVDFLKKYVDVVELRNGNSSVAIVPGWQGRVMTSTSAGNTGYSFGWINRELISSGISQPHIMPFGGEERLWLGPEGGQYSIFFKKGDEFVYENWQTPAFLDTLPFTLISIDGSSALFSHNSEIENYSGTRFRLQIDRKITLLSVIGMIKETGIDPEGTDFVAYRSDNTLINRGKESWKKETGLLSVWMLGMFIPSPGVIVAIPFREGDEKVMGPAVNDNYFGKIPDDRLRVRNNMVFFRADGKSRGKIGISPLRSKGIMGSYDFDNKILTLLVCRLPEGITDYVNSAWEIQDNPYSGDALNSYNDGPLEDGSQMGPFYELETSSPAAALKPGESLTHSQITIHLTGNEESLNRIALESLGVSLDDIRNIFK